ncbi:hypothetical protein [Polaribacter sp.]|uniref:hypothetical protein n=1 Tax=Polaribacter sp. TaxID=1920175 RepID=UPI004047DE23
MKRKHINIIILVLVVAVFGLQYYFITSYVNEIFQYTPLEIRNEVLNKELESFKMYLIESFVILSLQSIGIFLCLNIGFLYFKIKVNFKNILNLVVLSFIAVIINQLLLMLIVKCKSWTFLMNSIQSASEKLNIENYISISEKASWIKLSLTSINLVQILVLVLLTVGIHKIIKLSFNKAFLITVRTYGLGILLWFVFAMVMEMNFS